MLDVGLLGEQSHECLPKLVADVNLGPPAPLTCNPHVGDRGLLTTAPGSLGSLPPCAAEASVHAVTRYASSAGTAAGTRDGRDQ
jgi:hypothetical protein